MPRPKVGGVHHHCVVKLLQHRVREDSTTTGNKEALTLDLSQRQQHCWVFWRNIEHLGRSERSVRKTTMERRGQHMREI